ncbi:AI-2E family transporter [Actinoplanes sp. NPDC049316]|uniref:AI-2E family transporter n=1 Tax=Actinoplanes sp. NPDC049316 TaxID=3154727 RepID=UPI0034339191
MGRASVSHGRPALRVRGHGVPHGNGAAGLPRGLIVLLGLAGAVVAVAGLRIFAEVLAPVFLALMLTVTASPLGAWLIRRGAPAWLAATALVAVVYAVLIALGAALAVSVARLVALMPQYQDRLADLRASASGALTGLGLDAGRAGDLTASITPGAVADAVQSLLGGLLATASNAVFLLAVLLFLCLDAVSFPARLHSAAVERPEVVGALRSFAGGTRRYLLVSTIFGLIVAVMDTLALWALDIPLPVLWGLLSFITNYIPNIGFVVGLVPPALLGLLEGGVPLMTMVIVLYSVVNFVIQSVIQPKIVGDAVGLSATASFLSLVFWTWVLGPLGALLAIPLSLLTKGLLVDADPRTRWIDSLISSGPPRSRRRAAGLPAPGQR